MQKAHRYVRWVSWVGWIGWNEVDGRGLKASPEDPSQEPSSVLLTPSLPSPHSIYPGDIEVFKDMQIKELNLDSCHKLTGEWCACMAWCVGWMKLRG